MCVIQICNIYTYIYFLCVIMNMYTYMYTYYKSLFHKVDTALRNSNNNIMKSITLTNLILLFLHCFLYLS